MDTVPIIAGDSLVKHTLADRLREQIVLGALGPGERIVEGAWARRFGVAQASIREAINILGQQGFITKAAGRSARVIDFSEQDVLDLYELRGVLEGLAARKAAEMRADTQSLGAAIQQMRDAVRDGDAGRLLDADRAFHLELCRMAANPFVTKQAERVLLPFFAFVRMRVLASGQSTEVWGRDLDSHQRMVDLIAEGEGAVAEAYVHRAMARYAQTAYGNWQRQGPR
jgi:DNA-binding GntR family transcriptional regulator